jgi:hypothetical protein
VTTSHKLTIAALQHLQRCRRPVAFARLLAAAREAVQPRDAGAADVYELRRQLLKIHLRSNRIVDVHAYDPPFVLEAGARPVASPWARYQARHGREVTTLRHERTLLEPLLADLVAALDGTRDRAALDGVLADSVRRRGTRTALSPNDAINRLARLGLLIG